MCITVKRTSSKIDKGDYMPRKLLSGVAGLAFLVAATSAQADLISGTGDPIDDAALTGGTAVDFDSEPAGQYNSRTIGAVTFSGVDAPFTIGPDFNGQFNTEGGQSMFNDFDFAPTAFRFDFAGTVGAFAFNWGAADFNWLLSAFDSGGILIESFIVPPTFGSNSGEYFGIQAAGIAFATLVGQGGGDYVFIDDFTSTGAVVEVPEPASMALFGAGLLGLGLMSRRKKAKRVAA
jgi:hypothetical protein